MCTRKRGRGPPILIDALSFSLLLSLKGGGVHQEARSRSAHRNRAGYQPHQVKRWSLKYVLHVCVCVCARARARACVCVCVKRWSLKRSCAAAAVVAPQQRYVSWRKCGRGLGYDSEMTRK